MKQKMMSLLLILAVFSGSAFAQFEGKVVYELDYELPEAMEAQRSMLPPSMDMYIGKNNVKIVQKTMMGDQTVLTDIKTKETVMLMDMMGQKMAIKTEKPSDEDREKYKPEFKYDNKTKKIAGYKCKHAVMVVKDENGEELEYDVYYTEEIPAQANTKLEGLKGFPLEYTIKSGALVITMTAKSVEKKKIDKKEFSIPEGYKIMTMDEFKKMMSSGQ